MAGKKAVQSTPTTIKSPTPSAITARFFSNALYRKRSLKSNIGPKIRNAIRAGIGNDVKVAAINASDVLHKVRIPAIAIMATTERIGLEAKGKIIR
jgi:hypothetical protein